MEQNRTKYRVIIAAWILIVSASILMSETIENLTIEGETDFRQVINYAPVFSWEIADSSAGMFVFMNIRKISAKKDSLIWATDTLPYFGSQFQFRRLGALKKAQSYCFTIYLMDRGFGQVDSQALRFTMNTPPDKPGRAARQPFVFETDPFHIPLSSSSDKQIADHELKYHLQIVADTSSNIFMVDSVFSVTDTLIRRISVTADTAFVDNAVYYYRFRVSDGVESSDWGQYQTFFVNLDNDPPQPFKLLNPVHNDTLKESPVLSWQGATDPDTQSGADSLYYQILYSTDPTFNYYVKKLYTQNNQINIPVANLENHRRYYWKVTATDSKGLSAPSDNTGSFTLNTGNSAPAAPVIIAPKDRQALIPQQYILWQFSDDPDGVDRLSFTVYILNSDTKSTVFEEHIPDSLVTASRFGLAEDFSIGYNNLVQYQLRRVDLSLLEDGRIYDVRIAVNDNWGGWAATSPDEASFQYDDNINQPPMAPAGGFYPHDIIVKTVHPRFSWNAGSDSDVNDQLKYRIQISRDSSLAGTHYISQQSRYNVTRIKLRTALIENSTYFWRVQSIDLEESQSPWSPVNQFKVNQYNESPREVSALFAPADLSEVSSQNSFLWKPVCDPDPGDSVFYTLLIDDKSDFVSPEIAYSNPGIAHPSTACPQETLSINFSVIGADNILQDNQLYFWKIVATDRSNIGGSTASAFSRFVYNPINNSPHRITGTFSPTGSAIVTSLTPELKWPAGSDPDFLDLQKTLSYRIQLSNDPLFAEDSVVHFSVKPGETTLTLTPALVENQKYFYRVQALDAHGAKSDWSTLNSFITNAIPEAPATVSGEFNPKDSLIIDSNEPVISWLPVEDPDPGQHQRDIYYTVRYFRTKKPQKYSYSKSEKGVPGVQLFYLKEDNYYGYQVSATGPDGLTSPWSRSNYFGVNAYDNPPSDFYPISPSFYEDSVLTDMSFQWTISEDKDLGGSVRYILYYSTDSTFTSDYFEASIEQHDSVNVIYRPAVPLEREQKYFWKLVAIDNEGNQTWALNSHERPLAFTTIGYSRNKNASLPRNYALFQNYPNPFNQQTVFKYSVPEVGPVDVVVYDVLGKRIKTLASGSHQPGTYEVIWDGTDSNGSPIPGGMYICRMSARNFSSHRKVLLMK